MRASRAAGSCGQGCLGTRHVVPAGSVVILGVEAYHDWIKSARAMTEEVAEVWTDARSILFTSFRVVQALAHICDRSRPPPGQMESRNGTSRPARAAANADNGRRWTDRAGRGTEGTDGDRHAVPCDGPRSRGLRPEPYHGVGGVARFVPSGGGGRKGQCALRCRYRVSARGRPRPVARRRRTDTTENPERKEAPSPASRMRSHDGRPRHSTFGPLVPRSGGIPDRPAHGRNRPGRPFEDRHADQSCPVLPSKIPAGATAEAAPHHSFDGHATRQGFRHLRPAEGPTVAWTGAQRRDDRPPPGKRASQAGADDRAGHPAGAAGAGAIRRQVSALNGRPR